MKACIVIASLIHVPCSKDSDPVETKLSVTEQYLKNKKEQDETSLCKN